MTGAQVVETANFLALLKNTSQVLLVLTGLLSISSVSPTPLPVSSPLSSHCRYCSLCTCLPPNNDLSVLSWLNTWLYSGQQQYTSNPYPSQWLTQEEEEGEEDCAEVYYEDSGNMNKTIDTTFLL